MKIVLENEQCFAAFQLTFYKKHNHLWEAPIFINVFLCLFSVEVLSFVNTLQVILHSRTAATLNIHIFVCILSVR